MPIKATLRHPNQLLLLLFGSSGICDISAKSISAFHFSLIPGRCPAPTTATTFDALQMTSILGIDPRRPIACATSMQLQPHPVTPLAGCFRNIRY